MPVNLQNGTSFVNDADPINLIIILHMFDTILVDRYIPATVGGRDHCSFPKAIDEKFLKFRRMELRDRKHV